MSLEEYLTSEDIDAIDVLANEQVEADYNLMDSLVQGRKDSGLTLAQVSERMGISESSVRDLERTKNPLLSTLRRYTLAIGAKVGHEVTLGEIDPHRGI